MAILTGFHVLCCLTLLSFKAPTANGDGNFYVGLLMYDNDDFRECCHSYSECGEDAYCNLLFQVTVTDIDSYNETLVWRASDTLTPRDAVNFPSEKFTNPIHFDFYSWNGSASVSVEILNVYDNGTERLVDSFDSVFQYNAPSIFFNKEILESDMTQTNLSIVYRYDCGETNGDLCWDCLPHYDVNDTCSPRPSQAPSYVTVYLPGNSNTTACSDCDTTTEATETTTVTSTEPTTTTTVPTTTTTTTEPGTSATTTTVSSTLVTEPTTQTTTTVKKTHTTRRLTRSTRAPTAVTSTTTPSDTELSTPDERIQYVDNPTAAYWPAIVGGVLGAVALFAAAGFICYFNRQKKLQKRQEIYNVNPKVLRNFEEYTESGTSGRADVPMETEQY